MLNTYWKNTTLSTIGCLFISLQPKGQAVGSHMLRKCKVDRNGGKMKAGWKKDYGLFVSIPDDGDACLFTTPSESSERRVQERSTRALDEPRMGATFP